MAERASTDMLACLLEAVGSIDSLEILLLLRRARDRVWSAQDIALELDRPAGVVEATLADLRARGLVDSELRGSEIDWRYAPRSADIAERLDRTAGAHDDKRLEMMRELCFAAMEHARETADLLGRVLGVADQSGLVVDGRMLEQVALGEGFLERAARRGFKLVDIERAYLHAVLRVVGGNKSEAARRLGINRRTLQRRLGDGDEIDDDDDDEDIDDHEDEQAARS